jgi:hypothetical protein
MAETASKVVSAVASAMRERDGAAGAEASKGGAGGTGPVPGAEAAFHDEELSFIEPVYATKTAIHPAPRDE